MRFFAVLFFVLIAFNQALFSQNIEKINSKDRLKVSGGLNYNSVFYNSTGMESRRDPFTWFLNGNLNFSILDWSIPFSYSYSNQHGTFTQPFNQYGLMPEYKWFKSYLGYNNITFSPYTLSGYVFMGAATELNPGNWKFALMYGRMNKAVQYDALNQDYFNMSYERWGKGFRCGYEEKGKGIFLNYFQASDKKSSLLFVPMEAELLPQQNTVLSVEAKTNITKKITAETEYALSGITRNSFAEADASRKNYLPGLFKMRSGSYFANAFKANLGYKSKLFGVNMAYERVSPDYITLGTYYFNNDLENITLAPSVRLFKEKLLLSLNTGLQKNNLDKSKMSTVRRWVGSANVSYNLNTRMMLSGSYSNFTTYTRMRAYDDPYYNNTLDTLNFYQLSQNGFFLFNYLVKRTPKLLQSITFNSSYQVSGEKNNDSKSIPAKVLNLNLGYAFTQPKLKTNYSVSVNMNQSDFLLNKKIFLGPGFSYSKAFDKTLKFSFASAYNLVIVNGINENTLINNRVNITWTPKVRNEKNGKPSVNFSITDLYRAKTIASASSNEFTAMVNLMYSF